MYGLSLQSGECFGFDGNWSDRLRVRLVSLGLGLKNVCVESGLGVAIVAGGGVAGVIVGVSVWFDSVSLITSGKSVVSGASIAIDLSSCISSIFGTGGGSLFDLCFNWKNWN